MTPTPETSAVTEPGGGETGDNGASARTEDTHIIKSLEELLSTKGRHRLRELAQNMKLSGALRIKDHRLIQGNFPNSFKGEYARDWILANEKLVSSVADALRVGQAMLDLSIFHCITTSNIFDGKHLYAFRSDNLGTVANLQRRVVAIEDHNIAQTKANKEAQADAVTKSVQLDWRISVAERRLAASESTLRRTIVVQQVLIGTLLSLLLVTYAPLGRLSTYLASLGTVMLIVVLLESRRVLNDFLSFKIDYNNIASGIMGLHLSEEADESMNRTTSLDASYSSGSFGTNTLDVATKTATDLLSSMIDSVKSGFDTVRSTVTAPAVSSSSQPPRGILHSGVREKPSKLHRTTFTLPSDDAGNSEMNGSDYGSNPRLARCSMPVLPAAADAAVADAGWSHARPVSDQAEAWRSQQDSDTARHTFELPMYMPPAGAYVARSRSPQSGGPSSPASPMGAPPGPPCASDFEDWWTPDMVVRQPYGDINLTNPRSTRGRVRINHGESHEFDGRLFKGRIMVFVKGLREAGEGGMDVFKKKRRMTWIIVQGRFKQRIPVSEVYTGQMFGKKIEDVPQAVVRAVTFLVQSFTRVVSNASVIENSDAPVVIYPLILAAQSVHVCTPGFEPELSPFVDLEDASLMSPGGFPDGQAPSVAERKAFFSKTANRKDVCYEPSHIYTFHVRQHIVDVANYSIPVPGFGKFSLLPYLQGQPIRFMAYDRRSQSHLWNLEAWHRGLIDEAVEVPAGAMEMSSGAGESASQDSGQGSNTLALSPEQAAITGSSLAKADTSPFSAQRHHYARVGQGAAVQKQSHSSLAFGHDGSFGHDGAVIQRAPSSAPKYSNVSIALPEPPQLSRDSSAAATPKLFAHTVGPTNLRGDAQKPPSSLRLDAQKRMSACDMIFNTVPSAFKPSSSVYGSQQVGSDMASVHSAFPAVSEDGNADWYSDKASDTSKLLDAFDGQSWANTPRSGVSAESMPASSRDTQAFETQLSGIHRRGGSDASVTFRGAPGSSPRVGGSPSASGGSSSVPGDLHTPKKKKFRLKKLFRRATKH